jgi:uncharacterized membrane protein
MIEWIGRFHPVVVHLPIGILLLAALFEWLILRPRFEYLDAAINTMLWLGTAAAGVSCVTGLLLAQSGDYAGHIQSHEWLGISVFLFSLAYALFRWLIHQYDLRKWLAAVLIVLITITGHLGGTLTHGEDFLLPQTVDPVAIDWKTAYYFDDVIQPVLQNRCISCHGPNKQKGALRLDGRSWIEKGGESGAVLIAGDASGSELLQRVLLPLNHEDHMPPKEKPPLTKEEITWLEDWINTGASFDKKFVEVSSLTKFASAQPSTISLPEKNISAAPLAALDALQRLGGTAIPVSQQSNYLSVALTNTTPSDSLMDALNALRDHIVWLKADCKGWTPPYTKALSQLPNLNKIWFNKSALTDDCLLAIEPGKLLQAVNLTDTHVTLPGVEKLLERGQLAELYLFQTNLLPTDIQALQKKYPVVRIEGGGYEVPTLASDTTEVK